MIFQDEPHISKIVSFNYYLCTIIYFMYSINLQLNIDIETITNKDYNLQ